MLSRSLLLGAALATLVTAAETSPLASAGSEFVRAQAASKVRWHAWNEAALAAAKASGRSVYVFIGSPLSELSRATINQTFTSEKTVTWLNESFFCIFVDADASPEVAALGQHFINTVKQLKGSPVHLWLTPDTLQPYDGANYLPPSEEWGKPGFLKAARAALDTWQAGPDRAHALAEEAIEMMKLPALGPGEAKPEAIKARLDKAAAAWVATLDAKNGGFGSAPKLPEPELIRFLLKRDKAAQDAALNAARALVNGALRDSVDGGFYRRCIDEAWKEPYCQKTLIDQARIALALFDAADVAKDEKLRAAGVGALDFVLKELNNRDDTFAVALDGTLEENVDLAKRPKFVKVGTASDGALALLRVALHRTGKSNRSAAHDKGNKEDLKATNDRPEKEMGYLAPTIQHVDLKDAADSRSPQTASDLLGLAWLMRVERDESGAKELLKLTNDAYFDGTTGTYMASPANLPPGIAARVPTSGNTPSAEVLALLVGTDAKTADLIRRNLMNQIEYDELPPGDILLGLSQGLK